MTSSMRLKPEPREITIIMPYEKNLSVNHYLNKSQKGFFVRSEVKAWKEELGWLIKGYHIEDWNIPIEVWFNAKFADNKVRDLSNYSKVVLDAIEETTGVNDTKMRWHDGWQLIKTDETPEFMIVIKEAE